MKEATLKITERDAKADETIVRELYEVYAKRLFNYTKNKYNISEDDAHSIVYTTIYRVASVYDRYSFDNKHKQAGFIFRTHINFLRNYFRLNKNFEFTNQEVELHDDHISFSEEEIGDEPTELKILKSELEKLDEWQRILLLMRGQDMPYSEIARFVNKPEKQLKVYYGRLKNQLLHSINEQLKNLPSNENGK